MLSTILKRFFIFSLVLLLASCAVPQKEATSLDQQLSEAANLLSEGDHQGALDIYARLARNSSQPERDRYQLLALEAALTPELIETAKQYLEVLDDEHLNHEEQARKRLAMARIALIENHPGKALDVLAFPTDKLSPPLQREFLSTQAQASLASGLNLEAIQTYLKLETLIDDPTELQENRDALWAALVQTDSLDLYEWSGRTSDPVLKGWMELAYIANTTPIQGGDLDKQLDAWAQAYPQHPANPAMLIQLRSQWAELQHYPARIAVLLPQKGRLAAVSQAISDGLLAAYYDQPSDLQRPDIRFYDTSDKAISMSSLYDQAVADGAEFIIGPLDKDNVEHLANSAQITIPVLALNTLDSGMTPPDHFYQFGLAPEDEARQAAERASIDGYEFAIAFAPKNNWGQRILESFTKRYEELSGTVLSKGYFNATSADYSSTIMRALNIDQSELRARKVQTTIKQNAKFEPRRRQDVQFVFIAATPRQARLIKPQLKYHRAGDLPVYATSHVFSGQIDKNADRDLDGIIYSEIPWLIEQANPEAEIKAELAKLDPDSSNKYPRLMALGVDSYRLIPYLPRLSAKSYEHFEGVTGNLSLDADRRVHRQLKWARFKRGIPVSVTQNTDTPEDNNLQP
jgi:uncharacterized protein